MISIIQNNYLDAMLIRNTWRMRVRGVSYLERENKLASNVLAPMLDLVQAHLESKLKVDIMSTLDNIALYTNDNDNDTTVECEY